MRAVVYVRVSTEEQSSNTSLDRQESEGRRYCEGRGYTAVEVIADSASGGNLERPGIARLRELLKAQAVDVVVAYAVDRLSRNQNQVGVLFDDIARAKARLELVAETFEDTAVGRFILAARAFVAEVEREKIRDRTARGKRDRAAQGHYIPSRVPFGYARRDGHLVIDEPTAEVVRSIFQRFIEGESYRGIALALNTLGIESSRGRPWERQVIKKMLTNESYTGVMSYMDVRIPDALPVIIDSETFERVRRQIDARPPRGNGKGAQSVHLLTGILYCGECNGKMYGRSHTKGSMPRVYDCGTYNKGMGCISHPHDAEELEREVVELVNDIASDYGRVQALREDAISRVRADVATVEGLLRQNDAERQNVLRAVRKGVFTDEQAMLANREVAEDYRRLAASLEDLKAKLDSAERDREHAESLPAEAKKLLDEGVPLLQKKRILSTALAGSAVVVETTGRLHIQ